MAPDDPPADLHAARVRAAGGVVWREGPSGLEVLLVHRPRYDDWSLPKGKLDEGESFEAAAVREVAEETGVAGELGADLGEVRYVDHRGRPKVVRWWSIAAPADHRDARATADEEEVDARRWVPLDDVEAALTYPTDVAVVQRFRGTVGR